MEFFKKVRNFLIIFFIFCCATAGIDYYRLTIGKMPVFCIKEYNEKTQIESYRGFFYTAERKVKWDRRESMNLADYIKFTVLTKEIPIVLERPKVTNNFIIYPVESEDESILYYETKEIKVYTNGLSSIQIKKNNEKNKVELNEALKQDKNLLETIINQLAFKGLVKEETIEKYESRDDSFVLGKIYVYRCSNETKDIYITKEETIKDDYCIDKNDSTLEEQEQ